MEHLGLYEIAYGESNDHVTDDANWPWRSRPRPEYFKA